MMSETVRKSAGRELLDQRRRKGAFRIWYGSNKM